MKLRKFSDRINRIFQNHYLHSVILSEPSVSFVCSVVKNSIA
jgi:hypothetical protein